VTTVERAAGSDRYGTAAALAGYLVSPHTVYVATGENFPDALASAPAAARDGAPLLLVSSAGIPSVTREALERISPEQIIILGGTGVIPESVATQLEAYGEVTRIAGSTRYSTAVAIAETLPGTGKVMVVSGEDYVDAAAAGAAAGFEGVPLILVKGSSIPAESRLFFSSRRLSTIEVIGGPAAVAELVRATLIDYVYPD
jgi:putative cell wall-binding protein